MARFPLIAAMCLAAGAVQAADDINSPREDHALHLRLSATIFPLSQVSCVVAENGHGFELGRDGSLADSQHTKSPKTYAECPASLHAKLESDPLPAKIVVAVARDVREPSPLQNIIRPPAHSPPMLVVSPPPPDDEELERHRITQEAKWSFIDGWGSRNMEKVEALFARYRSTKERTPSGVWKLTMAYHFVDHLPTGWIVSPSEAHTAKSRKQLDDWQKAFPQSPLPHLVEAELHYRRLTAIIRQRYQDEPIPGGAEGMRKELAKARQRLQAAENVASLDPHYFSIIVKFLNVEGAPFDDVLAISLEAAERFPNYFSNAFETVRALSQLSKSPFDDIEAFASTIADSKSTADGDEVYARIYWVVIRELLTADNFSQLRWKWDRIVTGMAKIATLYPNQWNVQNFAQMACMIQDQNTSKTYFDKVRGLPLANVWGQTEFFEACKAFAQVAVAKPTPGPNTPQDIDAR